MGSVPTKAMKEHCSSSRITDQSLPPLSFAQSDSPSSNNLQSSAKSNAYVLPEKDHIDIIKQLIGAQVNVGATNSESFSPLFIACHYGLYDVMKSLISKNADINTPDSNGFSPLYISAYKGHMEVVKLLLEAGVEINAGKGDITPLFAAAKNSHEDVTKLLLDHGADIDIVTDEKLTAYEVAATPTIRSLILAAHESKGLGICAICWETPVNASYGFVPCGHKIVCRGCNDKLLEKNMRNCPMCRSPIWCRVSNSAVQVHNFSI